MKEGLKKWKNALSKLHQERKDQERKDQERKLHQEENSKQKDFHMLIV